MRQHATQHRCRRAVMLGTLLVLPQALVVAAPPMPEAEQPLPPWQRRLEGEAKARAEALQKQIEQHWRANAFAQARKPARELVELREQKQGEDHWETINARWQRKLIEQIQQQPASEQEAFARLPHLEQQATALEARRRWGEVVAQRKEILTLCRDLLGKAYPLTADAHRSLGIAYFWLGQIPESRRHFSRALVLRRELLGEEHPDTASSYHSMGLILEDRSDYVAALGHYQKALALRRQLLGEMHARTAATYSNLANVQHSLGRYAPSERNYRAALAVRRKVFGEVHHRVAASYNNLAISLQSQGKNAVAEQFFRKALQLNRQLLGEDDPRTAGAYNNLAINQNAQGKYATAERYDLKALELRRKTLGEANVYTATSYNNLGLDQYHQGRYASAGRNLAKALALRQKLLPPDHPELADTYHNLALNQTAQGNFTRSDEEQRKALYTVADTNYRQALDLRRNKFGLNHPDTAASYSDLALNLSVQGRYVEAEQSSRQALEIRQSVLGEEHPETAKSYHNLALQQYNQGRFDRAQKNEHKALDLRLQLLGAEHPDTVASYSHLALCHYARGDYTEAESLWTKAVDLNEPVRLATAASGLRRALVEGGKNGLALAAVLARNGMPELAWERFEQALARGTWDDLTQRRALTQDELKRQTELREQLKRLDHELVHVLAVKDAAQRRAQLAALAERRLTTRQALEQLRQALEHRYGPAVGKSWSLQKIQASLPEDAALVGWVDLNVPVDAANPDGEHWAVLVRRQGEPRWVRLPGSGLKQHWTEADASLPERLRNALREQAAWHSLAQQLSRQRLEPLKPYCRAEGDLPPVHQLIVLPATQMDGVPLEVLTQEFTVSYAPSGTLFAYLKQQPGGNERGLLALADPIFEDVEPELPPGGLLVRVAPPKSNAARAGLQSDDVLLEYAGSELKELADLDQAVAAHAQDARPVPIRVWRDGKTFRLTPDPGKLEVVLAEEPAPKVLARRREEQQALALARGQEEGGWPELPGTRVEARVLSDLFTTQKRQVTLLTDAQAGEPQLQELALGGHLGKFSYVHLATHGELDARGMLNSRLILTRVGRTKPDLPLESGKPLYDGDLSAAEVLLSWKLDAELVTLSACQSALGRYAVGESYIGFPQALLLSGARSVCVSLWQINDSATALLMQRFYQNLLGARGNLNQPMSKAAALQEAKAWLCGLSRQDVLALWAEAVNGVDRGKRKLVKQSVPALPPKQVEQDRPYAHPYYWSGFILIGAPD